MNKVTLAYTSLKDYTLKDLPRLELLREELFGRVPEICIERARYVTEYLRDMDDPADEPELRQAKKVRHFLEHKTAVFHDANLLAGSTTSKALGAPLFPEFLALTAWPELDTISTREKNPMTLSPEDAKELNFKIFPFWMEGNVLEKTRKRYGNTVCLDLFEQMVFFLASKAGTLSHTIPGYAVMLEKGLAGICRMASEKEDQLALSSENGATRRKASFYQAMRIALEGVMKYAERLADYAENLAKLETDTDARRELEEMANICRVVPANPATTFREAVNAIWICQVGIHAENINYAISPGRLDQVLYPYYRRDMEAGKLTVKDAIELVGCLWLKLSDNVIMVPEAAEQMFGGSGTAPAVTLGGVDSKGEDAVNDLTCIMLQATKLLRTRDPNVNARYHPKNDGQYLDRVSDVILETKAIPAIYNDEANIAALLGQKETEEHANDYGIIGCVELGSSGRDYPASSSIMFNLVAPLEMALFEGKRPITGEEQIGPKTPDPADGSIRRFEDFYDIFLTQLDWLIEQAIQLNEQMGPIHQEMMPSPLLSAFFEGPLDNGLDLIRGGALYNSSGATQIGFADVVDSLSAIEKAVFVDKKYTFAELLEGIRNNFSGDEGIKMGSWLRNNTPRYGTMDAIALKNSQNLAKHLFDIYQAHTNYRNGPYRPAYWTMTNHAGLGGICGALPYGRNAGQVLSSGITPVSGAAHVLPDCLSAVATLGDGKIVPGCWALNLKYTPLSPDASVAEKDKMKSDFKAAVLAFFKLGGQQIQFNIMDYHDLMRAKLHPEEDPHLLVRVSGYSAYFNDLNDMMKDELIMRTQYDLSDGQMVPLPKDIETELSAQPQGSQAGNWEEELESFIPLFGTAIEDFINSIKTGIANGFLDILLELMKIMYRLPLKYRKNIENFEGKYQFLSLDGGITTAVIFKDGSMNIGHELIADPNITITFRDESCLMKLLLAPRQDILDSMLHHDVRTKGNLNYLYKLGYMARQLQLLFVGCKQ